MLFAVPFSFSPWQAALLDALSRRTGAPLRIAEPFQHQGSFRFLQRLTRGSEPIWPLRYLRTTSIAPFATRVDELAIEDLATCQALIDLPPRSVTATAAQRDETGGISAVFLAVTQYSHGRPATDVTAAVAAVALIGGAAAALRGREGWAFTGTALTLVLAVATLFGDLWPNVLPSSTSAAYSLTVTNASSAHYTLVVMSWVAIIFTPVVLAYQGWTYWVFRKRLSSSDIPATEQAPKTVEHAGGHP